MSLQFNSSLQLLQVSTRSNSLISALNTNTNIRLNSRDDYISLEAIATRYFDVNVPQHASEVLNCFTVYSIAPAGIYALPYGENPSCEEVWPGCPFSSFIIYSPNASAMIDGFFGGCTPLDALLAATFDCLHNIDCLKQFSNHFPNLDQVSATSSFVVRNISLSF